MQIKHGADITAAVSTGAAVNIALTSSVGVNVSVGTQTQRLANPYIGPYDATPAAFEQSLPTAGKSMNRNITIHKVPYQETTNESGGYTVSILS